MRGVQRRAKPQLAEDNQFCTTMSPAVGLSTQLDPTASFWERQLGPEKSRSPERRSGQKANGDGELKVGQDLRWTR